MTRPVQVAASERLSVPDAGACAARPPARGAAPPFGYDALIMCTIERELALYSFLFLFPFSYIKCPNPSLDDVNAIIVGGGQCRRGTRACDVPIVSLKIIFVFDLGVVDCEGRPNCCS